MPAGLSSPSVKQPERNIYLAGCGRGGMSRSGRARAFKHDERPTPVQWPPYTSCADLGILSAPRGY